MDHHAADPFDTPKGRQILDGARAAFLESGFEGASVDEIARRAGVSKGTMYNYFPDKRSLFSAMIRRECREQARHIFQIDHAEADNVEATLRRIARAFVEFVTSPFAQRMFRITVAETLRFPELGRAFMESGPALGIRRLSQYFAFACGRGDLAIDDVELAAHQFAELCKAELFFRTLFDPDTPVAQSEIGRVADAAVKTFLRAYRPA